ncbi:mandelate racemase/muconate lactonizing enzyme family protein [Sinomonas albida]|uniref:mandelate racemase/muconate lactonizing enzyme family protein n=1 Tax=Sinomonas albida TaxID=369942 RepID=UPI0010A87455|nr:mandelate racemase/muconate lactonizing enzyme family protein [Sinomonas albida]
MTPAPRSAAPEPVLASLRTRLLVPPLPRPWGPDVPEVHFVVVDVEDSAGHRGTGFSWTPTVGAGAVVSLLNEDIAAAAIGGPTHPEAVWDALWVRLHEAGGGGLTTIALAGLDLALWDLLGKRLGVPVADLLGRRRTSMPAYGSGVNLHYSLDELLDQVRRWIEAGYGAVKIKVGKPELAEDVERVAAVRELLGPRRRLMIDANQRWDLPTARRAVVALERFGLHWLEEPLRAEDLEGHAQLRRSIGVPIATGENLHTLQRFREYVAAGACDIIQPNIVRVGGITPFRRIAALARTGSVALAPHLLTDLSAQLVATLPGEVEVEEVEDTAFESLGVLASPSPVRRKGAEVTLEPAPGLGLDFVERLAGP